MIVKDYLDRASIRLRNAGIENARQEARTLVAAAMGCRPGDLIGFRETELSECNLRGAERNVTRREDREPVSRILGRREFWSLSFELSKETLDPRPDSETLVGAVLEELPDRARSYSILDLGTGTGCLLLSLLHELPNSTGLGVDISRDALAAAGRNAFRHGMSDRASFVQGSWADAIGGHWDVIVSNPPYVARDELAALEPEVRLYDPVVALLGGDDGLRAYCEIVPGVSHLLAKGGLVALELGVGQAQDVMQLAVSENLQVARVARDLRGIERCLIAKAEGIL